MRVFTSLGIIVFSMLILGSMQLVPGVFSIFAHYAFGKYSQKKASDLTLFFVIGAELIATIIILLVYFLIMALSDTIEDLSIAIWILCGILCSLSLASALFYFRKGAGTKLFIPRSLSKNLTTKAQLVKNRSDAFILGIISIIPELIFTLPVYFIASLEIMKIGNTPISRAVLLFLIIISVILPTVILYFRSKNYNLADYLKFRFKNKNFFRCAIIASYLAIVILILLEILS